MLPGTPPPAPRRFRLTAVDATTTFLLLFGGIWGLVGLFLAGIFTVVGGPFWTDIVLDQRGVAKQATPTRVERTSSLVNGRAVYRVVFTLNGKTDSSLTSETRTTDADNIGRATAGQPLTIVCDPEAPSVCRLAGERASVFGLLVLLPTGFALVGIVILAIGLRRLMRVRETYVNGLPVRAKVTAVSPTFLRVNRQRVMRVDYTFDALIGPIAGRTTSRAPPPIGSLLWVLHLPDEPARNVVA